MKAIYRRIKNEIILWRIKRLLKKAYKNEQEMLNNVIQLHNGR